MRKTELKQLLEELYLRYNNPSFIGPDPVCVPHRYTRLQDIEIAGLFAALLAWGQRSTIINNANRLMDLMDDAPYDFMLHHTKTDRKRFKSFVHRTFQPQDLEYFLISLQHQYKTHNSLETLFADGMAENEAHVGPGLVNFHRQFFSLPHLPRTEKHLQNPDRKSACKRINLFLRWMVRKDLHGVDFGLWTRIKPSQLLCPLDVHVQRTAQELGLLKRTQSDWQACLELTEALRRFDPADPVKYDFALFGMGMEGGKL